MRAVRILGGARRVVELLSGLLGPCGWVAADADAGVGVVVTAEEERFDVDGEVDLVIL